MCTHCLVRAHTVLYAGTLSFLYVHTLHCMCTHCLACAHTVLYAGTHSTNIPYVYVRRAAGQQRSMEAAVQLQCAYRMHLARLLLDATKNPKVFLYMFSLYVCPCMCPCVWVLVCVSSYVCPYMCVLDATKNSKAFMCVLLCVPLYVCLYVLMCVS